MANASRTLQGDARARRFSPTFYSAFCERDGATGARTCRRARSVVHLRLCRPGGLSLAGGPATAAAGRGLRPRRRPHTPASTPPLGRGERSPRPEPWRSSLRHPHAPSGPGRGRAEKRETRCILSRDTRSQSSTIVTGAAPSPPSPPLSCGTDLCVYYSLVLVAMWARARL